MSTHAERVEQLRRTLEGVYHEDLMPSHVYLAQQAYEGTKAANASAANASVANASAANASAADDLTRGWHHLGPLSVTNGHMPLAANEVAQLRSKATLRYVLTALVNLGATVGFVAFVLFLLTRVGA